MLPAETGLQPPPAVPHTPARVSTRRAVARAVRAGIREVHAAVLRRPLEQRLAIYFHQVESAQWDAFRACIEHFTEAGYRTVSAQEFVEPGNDRRLFVSFDDNFRNWHRMLPLLDDLGASATFYVNTLPFRDVATASAIAAYFNRIGMAGAHETLTRGEVAEIQAAGHTIGCHSHSHFDLARLDTRQWDDEIRRCKDLLEDIAGVPVRDFAWPYGMRRYFSAPLRRYCAERGFTTIANAISGCQAIASDERLDIYRTDWDLDRPLRFNLANLGIDGRLYARITGRSVIG